MKQFLTIALLLGTALCTPSTAADSLVVVPSTLRECLQRGLERNYSIRVVRGEAEMSANRANAAYAGLLPTVDLTSSYGADLGSTRTRTADGTSTTWNALDHTVSAGVKLNWTVFDGFSLWADYKRYKVLEQQGELAARLAVEDYVAELTAEYYNLVQQQIRLKNFRYAVRLSRERMRIVEERYHIGSFSRLDYQQAKVDFNADSAAYMGQQEAVNTSRIRLNRLMASDDVDVRLNLSDTAIAVTTQLDPDVLWSATMAVNTELLLSQSDEELARLERRKVLSRNYPYVKLNAGYGYDFSRFDKSATRRREGWGPNAGITVGFNLWDGKRRADRRNAALEVENARFRRADMELRLRADFNTLWQAYENHLQILRLERQNLIAAEENHAIASERYLLGDLSGFEMREAQKSLLDAEERILTAEYDTKVCEISLLQLSGGIMFYLQ